MSFEKSLANNIKVRLDTQYPIITGEDPNHVPQFLQVNADGALIVSGTAGFGIGVYDAIVLTRYGSTNNYRLATYFLGGSAIGQLQINYFVGVPTLDSALISGVQRLA